MKTTLSNYVVLAVLPTTTTTKSLEHLSVILLVTTRMTGVLQWSRENCGHSSTILHRNSPIDLGLRLACAGKITDIKTICSLLLMPLKRDAVTKDLNFRICPFPKTGNLYVATMGSNQGFKFMPIIGKYVADMLEGNLSPEYTKPWAWSFGRAVPPDVNPHPIPTRDLSELDGWQGKYLPGGPRIPWNFGRNKV